ncbi:MAG: hypothetical protein EXR75_10085 [Myxococcales bacterium]|nr:hypothetical protein [Myxococcales bacterium]
MLLIASAVCGCESYDSPPIVEIVGLSQGRLSDPAAPFALFFSEPVKPESLAFKVVLYETDSEGRFFDEDEDPATELKVFYRSDPATEEGGIGQLDEARRTFTTTLAATLPVGPPLALLIEPGLADDADRAWKVRQLVKFGFDFSCGDVTAPTTFPERGQYFFVIDVDKPVSAQIQLLADIRVDPASGDFVGQFTNADRNREIDCALYGLTCKDTEACRTVPDPGCVPPSERASNGDAYVDFVANVTPPTGYGFTVRGCIADAADGSHSLGNFAVDVVVLSPPVTVKAINLQSSWVADDQGVLRASGSFTAEQVFLGTSPSGAGVGSSIARHIPTDSVGPVPEPPLD